MAKEMTMEQNLSIPPAQLQRPHEALIEPEEAAVAIQQKQLGMGWLPDMPDFRDYTLETKSVANDIKRIGLTSVENLAVEPRVDLRRWCSPIENQGPVGSCTAQAGAALMEYYERRAYGNYIDASRLFLYKATRNLLGWSGDTGAFLRTTMGAMKLFGAPPERYWPYSTERPNADGTVPDYFYDTEPSAFCYNFAEHFRAINYFRLDPPGTSLNTVLTRVKALIAAKLPVMFGFTVFSSIGQAGRTGEIPLPSAGERVEGGHAVVAVGYDVDKKIKNLDGDQQTVGALLIRNSWGTHWGDEGYGWLPFDYIQFGLAKDWWTLFKSDYVETKKFGL